jgi:hypothetical protein
VPLVIIEHFWPEQNMKKEDVYMMTNSVHCTTVCVNNDMAKKWFLPPNTLQINYGIPNLYKEGERKDQILLVGNFNDNDRKYVNNIQKQIKHPIKMCMDTYENTIAEMRQSKYILNSTKNNISLVTLLGMSCGCIPITDKKITEQDYIYEDLSDVVSIINKLSFKENHQKMSTTICDLFDYSKFLEQWGIFLDTIKQIYYRI